MCDAGLALTVIGTAISGYSALSQGAAAASEAEYQAKVADRDAKLERSAAQVRADKIRRAGLQKSAEARVALAGSGVDVNAGTSVEINREIEKNTEADALAEMVDGSNRAARLEANASGYRAGAKSARMAGGIGAASQLVAGGAQVARGWKVYKAGQINEG